MNQRNTFPRNGYLLLIFVLILSRTGLSQTNVVHNLVAASHHATNASYSTQWAIGEIFTGAFESGGISVSNGLNETNVVFIVTDLETQNNELKKIHAFPNPMTGVLTIESGNFQTNELTFDFTDGSGKKINVPMIDLEADAARFNTEALPSGFYILGITNLKTTQTAYIKLIQK
jgi:hypothetical protein